MRICAGIEAIDGHLTCRLPWFLAEPLEELDHGSGDGGRVNRRALCCVRRDCSSVLLSCHRYAFANGSCGLPLGRNMDVDLTVVCTCLALALWRVCMGNMKVATDESQERGKLALRRMNVEVTWGTTCF